MIKLASISGRNDVAMTTPSHFLAAYQTSLFDTDLLLQLDPKEPLLALVKAISWVELEREFRQHYCPGVGHPALPIRLMVGLLLLKKLEDLSDEKVVLAFKQNPYHQAFCGLTEFSRELPCDSSELTHFRKRIGQDGMERLFRMSVALQGKAALEC